ncbi:MAG: hypothetical protein WAO61_02865 [Solirubrobacterales bacterium]
MIQQPVLAILLGNCTLRRMRDYFDQVRAAANSDLYFLALGGALTIPDMCAAMEANDGRSTGGRYKAWFQKHVSPKYVAAGMPSLSGEDAWGFRCSFLHQGRLQPHHGVYRRVLFVEPRDSGIVLHNNVINDALNLDAGRFVLDVVESADAWIGTAEQSKVFGNNFANFMQRYPNGLLPYIAGVPVIS